jgi:hypothetical protein
MRRIISVLAVAAMLAAMALGAAGAFAKPANEPLPNTFHHYAPERAKMGGFLGPHPPAPSKGLEWVMTSP